MMKNIGGDLREIGEDRRENKLGEKELWKWLGRKKKNYGDD